MKKSDIILIGLLLLLSLVSFGAVTLYSKLSTREPEAVVFLKGKEKGRYSLSDNITLEQAISKARNIIDSGAAMKQLETFIEKSNS